MWFLTKDVLVARITTITTMTEITTQKTKFFKGVNNSVQTHVLYKKDATFWNIDNSSQVLNKPDIPCLQSLTVRALLVNSYSKTTL